MGDRTLPAVITQFNEGVLKFKDEVEALVAARRVAKEVADVKRAEAAAKHAKAGAPKSGLSRKAKGLIGGALGVVGIVGLNDFGRKVLAEGKSPGQAAVEIGKETVTGIAHMPGMIASVPVEAAATAQDVIAADRAATQARERQMDVQFNRNLYQNSDNFRPFAGTKQQADAMFAPMTGVVEGVGDVIEGVWRNWKWLAPW